MYRFTDLFSSHLIGQYAVALAAVFIVVEAVSRIKQPEFRRIAVIGLSVLLLGWLDIWSLVLLICLSTVILILVKAKLDIGRIIYTLTFALIGLLLLIKDLPPLFSQSVYVPLGVSYYFFRLISFLIEYSKAPDKTAETPPLVFFSWVFFFPVFLAGPILRFDEFHRIDDNKHHARKPVYYRNLFLAIAAKVLLVDLMLYNFSYVTLQSTMELKLAPQFAQQYPYLNFFYLFAFAFSAFIHAYLDLLAYTEISKALAGILGFTNVDNFNRPLLASNISEFWQKWHMSLSNWTRDYIFFPMLIKTRRTWPSTYASMLILGIWHAATLNWIVWALAHATAINLYGEMRKTAIFKRVSSNPTGSRLLRVCGNIVTVAFVGFIFIFVAVPDFWHVVGLLSNCI